MLQKGGSVMNNNAKELCIEPMIFHKPGECPDCFGPLVVADSELTFMEIDQDGNPINEDTSVTCFAACLHCGKRIPMMRWKGSYIPYSEKGRRYKLAEFAYEIEKRKKELNKNSNGVNPFAIK